MVKSRCSNVLGPLPVLVSLLWVIHLRAENPPTYLYTISLSAVPGGFLTSYMSFDSSNNFYFTDMQNERVVKLDRNRSYLTSWGTRGTNDGEFSIPGGISLDSNDRIYVNDENNYRVEKFAPDGTYLSQWALGGYYPKGNAIDSGNNLYVADYYNNRIQKYDSNGNYLMEWGTPGAGNGQFNHPMGIAVDAANNVYVVDADNFRVQKFDSLGNYLLQWGSYGGSDGQFNAPYAIAADNSGSVYVTDQSLNCVKKFDSSGNFLSQWGSFGNGNGQFNWPVGIAVDEAGNSIYVSDFNYRIQVFVYNPGVIPPFLSSQPTNLTIAAGMNATFSVDVAGASPVAYQWKIDDVAVLNATNSSLTLTNTSLSDSGKVFSVLVANVYGSNLSSNSVLTVLPAIAVTQPANSISLTGAVLNGTVTVGTHQTLAWFQWGTDTNYGNVTAPLALPVTNDSRSVSVTLSNLPGNIYHCRLTASNDLGVVFGSDRVFTIGLAPTATTLSATNTGTGTFLNGTVNPRGWDTTVYFRWGPALSSSTLTNVTPPFSVGSGVNVLNVSNLFAGLTPSPICYYQLVASN